VRLREQEILLPEQITLARVTSSHAPCREAFARICDSHEALRATVARLEQEKADQCAALAAGWAAAEAELASIRDPQEPRT
jgi:hypothetical protein